MALVTSQNLPDFLHGWTVARSIPQDVIAGVKSGVFDLSGGVIRVAQGHDGAGRIIRHLIPVGEVGTPDVVLQHAARAMHFSGLNLAVSAVGFGIIHAKLTKLDDNLKALKDSVDGIARLLELDERAKLKSALKYLSMVMQEGSVDAREQQLLHGILNVFGPIKEKYQELLPESPTETAMACQEYFALTSLATAKCSAELGMVGAARRNLEDDFTFWARQARRIVERDFLGQHPERFMAGEFASDVPLSEVASWLNFVNDEKRSEEERINELRNKIHLSVGGDGSWIPWPPKEAKRTVEVDTEKNVPALRKLVACHGVLQGYVDQYSLLDENQMTPSEFQRKVEALDQKLVVDGYVILQPAPVSRQDSSRLDD